MTRYINADKIVYSSCILSDGVTDFPAEVAFKRQIQSLPEANVRENIYSKWVWDHNIGWCCEKCGCSNKNLPNRYDIVPTLYGGSKFCPSCGANMRD